MVTLYVKVHLDTGLKYFGKTTKDAEKYKGSGKYWKRHIKVHGYNVKTIIIGQFEENDPMLVETAENFSRENDIVNDKGWANFKPENGLDGGSTSDVHTDESRRKMSLAKKGKPLTLEHRKKLCEALKTRVHTDERNKKISLSKMGKPRSAETKAKISDSMKGIRYNQELTECPHCGKIGGKTGMTQYHFDNCLQNPNVDLGKRRKMKKLTCPKCGKEGTAPNMKRWHFDNCEVV